MTSTFDNCQVVARRGRWLGGRRIMTAADSIVVAAALRSLHERAEETAAENERLRAALRAITEVRYTTVGQSNADIAMAYVGAFSKCQGIAWRAIDAGREE